MGLAKIAIVTSVSILYAYCFRGTCGDTEILGNLLNASAQPVSDVVVAATIYTPSMVIVTTTVWLTVTAPGQRNYYYLHFPSTEVSRFSTLGPDPAP